MAFAPQPDSLPPDLPQGPAAAEALPQEQALYRLKTQMVCAVALSYAVDALVLAAYFACGTISGWVPLLYLACGFTECGIAYHYVRGPHYRAWTDRYLTLPRVATSCLIQLALIAIAPAIALYFLALLFIVFGFGSLRLRAREATILWVLVTAALVALTMAGVDVLQLPHATQAQRAIGLGALMLTVGRSTLIGLFASHLRKELGCRYREVRSSLEVSEADRTRTSIALHEDLSQDLAGIAMTLSAYAARLRQRNPAEAVDIDEASAQLRGAVEKARILAFPTLKQRMKRLDRDTLH